MHQVQGFRLGIVGVAVWPSSI